MSTLEDDGWKKIRAPKAWRPEQGEILEGTYLGAKDADGQFGPYRKYIISEDRTGDSYFVSGTVTDTLFATSMVQPGQKIRVVFKGMVETANGYYRDFDMYVKAPHL